MKETIYKKILDASWPRDNANKLKRVIEEHLENGVKIASANIDSSEINIRFDNGTVLTYRGSK